MPDGREPEPGGWNDDRGLYFDDSKPGDRFDSAPLLVSEALIVDFTRFYDPQVFHTDPQAAKETVYGGLIASGQSGTGVSSAFSTQP
jgi:acyl dehydratase